MYLLCDLRCLISNLLSSYWFLNPRSLCSEVQFLITLTEVDGVPECKTITWKLNKKGYRNKQLYLLLHLCTSSLLPQALLFPCNVHSLQKTALAATTWYNVSRLLSMLQEVFSYLGNKKLLNFCNLSQTGEKFASHHTSRE